MHDSRRYRDSAAECLLAAQEASQSHCRKLHLSMAISWLSLARQYESIERLFQGPGEAALIKGAHYLNGKWVYSTPESTSGTNSPYGIRSWKCRITAASVSGKASAALLQLDQTGWARLGRPGGGLDPPFLFTRYAMELMSCSDVYGFRRKR